MPMVCLGNAGVSFIKPKLINVGEKDMGLSNFPSPVEGVLLVLVMNTVLSVAFLKNMVRSLLQVMGATASNQNPSNLKEEQDGCVQNARDRCISIT
ncbi:putative e3 ubiquitin-protein ligase xerico [Quercus suber]|uniref:E3 ubiquitin-protein ligase xerico n=1 Tax=Quercus suber TaxID=58331 RepID=A0AAW0KS54_QUESU